jgi:hypothetical protein
MDTSNVDSVWWQVKRRNATGNCSTWLNRLRKMAEESRDYVVNKSGFKLPAI